MKKFNFSLQAITQTINSTLSALEEGKDQMFVLLDGARNEKKSINAELMIVVNQVNQIIDEVDRTEVAYKQSKLRLVEVSQSFSHDNESKIKEAYNRSNDLQTSLALAREKEDVLKKRREELMRRLKMVEESIQVAEMAATQFSAISTYLTGDLKNLDDVVKTAEQKIAFGTRIIQAQEDERLRIAREIHDGPAQTMANIAIRTEIVERVASFNVEKVKEELADFKKMIRESVSEVRSIIYDLRPMALDDLGLAPALAKYIDVYKERFHLPITFVMLGKHQQRLHSSLEVALFRIVQECLTNVRKHAKATDIKVRIEFLADKVILQIQDNGIGFIVNEDLFKNASHFGLIGMQERLSLINGTFEVISSPGRGTKISTIVTL